MLFPPLIEYAVLLDDVKSISKDVNKLETEHSIFISFKI